MILLSQLSYTFHFFSAPSYQFAFLVELVVAVVHIALDDAFSKRKI